MCSSGAASLGLQLYGMEQNAKATEEQRKFNSMSAWQQSLALESQAKELERSAKQTELQAEDAGVRGKVVEGEFRTEGKKISGTQTAQLGGSGFEVSTGTNIQLKADLESAIEADALTIRYNADLEKYGLHETARDERVRAADARQQAANARRAASFFKKAGRHARRSAPSSAFGLLG